MTISNGPSPQDLMTVFKRLYDRYGPRKWWPADSEFEVVVGAILTQNTAWKNVGRALANMREAGVWSMSALSAVPQDELARIIIPSGYFNTKARKLKEFASFVEREFGGDLDACLDLPAAELRDRLLGVWGIGEETADDIVLYAARKPSFVIDAYTRRIVDRLGWQVSGTRYEDYRALFTRRLPEDAQLFNEYHALLDHHGSRVCRPTPLCADCCLLDLCATGTSAAVSN